MNKEKLKEKIKKDLAKNKIDNNKNEDLNVLYEWQTLSKLNYHRSKTWYIIAISLIVISIAISLYFSNFLLAVIILLFTFIIFNSASETELWIEVALTDKALINNGHKIYYDDIEEFWISKFADIYFLNIKYKGVFSANWEKIILLDNSNPLKIRKILLDKNVKENTNPPENNIWEYLAYLLKL